MGFCVLEENEYMENMECFICNQIKQPAKDPKAQTTISCDSCKERICIECSELTATELRCFTNLQKKILKFHCIKCRKFELLNILRKTIEDKDEIIRLLQEKVKNLEKIKTQNTLSYANVLKHDPQEPTLKTIKIFFPNVTIKPKKQQSSNVTKEDINRNVNPAELNIGITDIKTTMSGSMVIKCQSKNESEILKQALEEKLSEKYYIDLTKLRQPKVKIVYVEGDYTNEEIEKYLRGQNHINGEFKIVYARKNKNRTKTIICECSASAFHQIINLKRVCIEWQRYRVYEDLSVPRCHNCQGYYHKKDNCRNRLTCPTCSDEHEEKNCPKKKEFCKNCTESNAKYKTKHATDHQNNSLECPTLKYHIDMLKNKTNYTPVL